MRIKILFTIAPLGLLAAFIIKSTVSCSSLFHPGIEQGIIEYKVSYKDPSVADLMPEKMILKFKKDKSKAEISAGMGFVTTSVVCDLEKKQLVQLNKIVMEKTYVQLDSSEINQLYENDPELEVELVPGTKKIAGYKCKKAIARYKNSDREPFEVYYTNELSVDAPNWANPYHKIEGTLMEYRIVKYGIEMHLIAESVSPAEITDEEFEIPDGYHPVSVQELDSTYRELQQSMMPL